MTGSREVLRSVLFRRCRGGSSGFREAAGSGGGCSASSCPERAPGTRDLTRDQTRDLREFRQKILCQPADTRARLHHREQRASMRTAPRAPRHRPPRPRQAPLPNARSPGGQAVQTTPCPQPPSRPYSAGLGTKVVVTATGFTLSACDLERQRSLFVQRTPAMARASLLSGGGVPQTVRRGMLAHCSPYEEALVRSRVRCVGSRSGPE